jgi:hypothetical protein
VRSQAAFELATLLDTDYTGYEALAQRGRGGVYQARDVSSMPRKLCVIKEGRRHGETDWLGRDGFIRLKREAEVLRSTGTTAVPRVLRAVMGFWQPGSYGPLCVGDFNHAANREDRIPNQSGYRL